jgi:type I restriction enzyme, S subunit
VSGAVRPTGAAALRRFKPYSAYKDSGVEWLGRVPVQWEIQRGDAFLAYEKLQVEPSRLNVDEVFHYSIPCIQETGDGRPEPPGEIDSAKLLITGDRLLVSKLNPRKGVVLIARPRDMPTVASTEFVPLRPIGCDLHWALYLYLAESTRERVSAGVRSATRSHQRAEVSDVLKIWHGVPSLTEQHAIAAFLDRETAKIDASVAKKERLIELLQEKRAALITRAVTKGLDSNAPMKDSGVDWLGAVPAHWDVEWVKWVARMESGHTPDKKVDSYWVDGNIPWVSLADTGQLREVDYIEDTAVRTTSDGIAHSSARILPPGTVVFSRDATIGLCAITRVPMAVSQHFIGWVCGPRLEPEYLLFAFRSMTQELERLTMGATVRTIGMPDVRSITTPVPPVSEQEKIVVYVREGRAQIDTLVEKIQDVIDGLREIRAALISAAVTGKIDVREEAA